ncbi:hypothetical protein [Ruminococcus sp.]|uniref:hypothetical protein n=1 Tax=Ruminococcus sp. TaxID=41978 RepID=UPI0025CCECF6|nr:hypothetical protein [Ruminococcus sp.]
MKNLKRITSLIAAAAMTLSMAAVNAVAAESTKSDTLLNRSRVFRVDDQVFTEKYADAVQRIEAAKKYFDLSIDPSYQYNDKVNIDYFDYMTIREKINDVYSRYNFSKTEYTFGEGASNGAGYDMVRCDVDGDEHYSYYDYCCMLVVSVTCELFALSIFISLETPNIVPAASTAPAAIRAIHSDYLNVPAPKQQNRQLLQLILQVFHNL